MNTRIALLLVLVVWVVASSVDGANAISGGQDEYCNTNAYVTCSVESCEPYDVWVLAKKAWSRKHGPTKADRREYRRLVACNTDPERARRKWQAAKRRYG